MTVTAGSELLLDVEKPVAGGRMLARVDGQVVLVWGALPGERVRARVERAARQVIYAETVDVLSASADRRPGAGDWRCGGNVYAHVAYERQRELKSEIIQDALARIGRLTLGSAPEVVASPERGYRMRARLHAHQGRLGFLREGTHEVCDVAATGQLLDATVEWLAEIQGRLGPEGLGGLASLEIAENVPATERVCHLRLLGTVNVNMLAALSIEGFLTGVTATRFAHDAQKGGRVERLSGISTVSDVVHVTSDTPPRAVRLRRDVRAFFQGNRHLLSPLVRHVLALAPPGPVVDLYAGVGLFGLSLAAAGRDEISLVEGDAVSGADLSANAEAFGSRVEVHRTSVEEWLVSAPPIEAATFIVDPPRTGLSAGATSGLLSHGPACVVYVSCDIATLARDLRTLREGGYELEALQGFDLFPNTAHVETVAVLRRSGAVA